LFGLLVSAVPLVLGIAFAIRPSERKLALMRPVSLAGIFAAVSSVFLGLVNALSALGSPAPSEVSGLSRAAIVLAEASVLPFIAFAFLTIAWLSVALGMRKQS